MLTETPICNFGERTKNFNLISADNKKIFLNDVKAKTGKGHKKQIPSMGCNIKWFK